LSVIRVYGQVGPRLIERGLSAIPIVPGEKRPGEYKAGQWVGMIDWQRFCRMLPGRFHPAVWSTWPGAGVAIALGAASNLSAVDLDHGSPEVRRAIEAVLPPSPVKKKGSKGYTAFYRGDRLASRRWMVAGLSVIELLADGRQTVIPPTTHPDGMPYTWLTDATLLDIDLGALPELPADFCERVDQVLAPFQRPEDRAKVAERPKWEASPSANFWREINDRALADRDAWVPELFPYAKRDGNGNFRVVAHWRHCERPNVSIHAQGITDWGAGQGHTAINLVMLAQGIDDPGEAAAWLKARLGMPQVEPILPARPTVVAPATPGPTDGTDEPRAGSMFDLDGALRLFYDHVNATAISPQPMLALGNVICALGALMGRRYRSETNLRTNIYAVGIADSGSGKDHSPKIVSRVLVEAGLRDYLGGNAIASGAGLLSAIHRQPSILFQIDEFGLFLQAIADRQRAPKHLADIISFLMQLYSKADTWFLGAEYANADGKRQRQDINQPCCCLFGTATPITFWGALTSANAKDGSLARFLIFKSEDDYPARRLGSIDTMVPPALIEQLQKISRGGSMGGGTLSGMVPGAELEPMVVPTEPEAQQRLKVLEAETIQSLRELRGTWRTSVYARLVENAIKLSLIAAVSANPEKPMIRLRDAEWGTAVATRSLVCMVDAIDKHVADNLVEARTKQVLGIVRSAGFGGISRSEITRKTQNLSRRDRLDTLDTLVEGGLVEEVTIESGSPGPKAKVYRSR
jgi:hypothetical protein